MKTIIFLLLVVPALAFAQSPRPQKKVNTEESYETEFHLLVEPVLGYQFVKRTYPYSHNEGMFIYGVRAVAGSQLITGELLYNHGSATETFAQPSITAESSRDIVRLGARTLLPVARWIKILFRAGEQASHDSFTYTSTNVTVVNSPAWQFTPYAGTGAIFHFIPELALEIEGTYMFSGDLETAMGFRLYI